MSGHMRVQDQMWSNTQFRSGLIPASEVNLTNLDHKNKNCKHNTQQKVVNPFVMEIICWKVKQFDSFSYFELPL